MSKARYGLIYFVTDGEAIKIGFTKNVAKRMGHLQVSHSLPLFLLGSIPATQHEELLLHRRFWHLRLSGEWFRITPELTDFLDELENAKEMIEGERIENYKRKLGLSP